MPEAIHVVLEAETDELGNVDPPGWYFWDETWAHRHGPFASYDEAQESMERYVREELGPHE